MGAAGKRYYRISRLSPFSGFPALMSKSTKVKADIVKFNSSEKYAGTAGCFE